MYMSEPAELSAPEVEMVQAGLGEMELGSVTTSHPAYAFDRLNQVWLHGEYSPALTPAFSLAPSEWSLGMTDDFMKSIRGVERTMQGRILEALSYIIKEPTAAHGDTVRPLSGDLKQCWRYRIGDYRLVYRADPTSKRVVLLAFAPRADSYR
jgi:mRNA-degrading endonuclease RelE of RelBE toxin-antitoxin system